MSPERRARKDWTLWQISEISKESLSKKSKLTKDQMARLVPDVHFKFRKQRAIPTDNEELKKYRINGDEFYQKNGCQYLEIRTGPKHVGLVKTLLKYFCSHFLTNVCGHHALMHNFIRHPGGRELIVQQRQNKLHIKHVKRLTTYEFKGIKNSWQHI